MKHPAGGGREGQEAPLAVRFQYACGGHSEAHPGNLKACACAVLCWGCTATRQGARCTTRRGRPRKLGARPHTHGQRDGVSRIPPHRGPIAEHCTCPRATGPQGQSPKRRATSSKPGAPLCVQLFIYTPLQVKAEVRGVVWSFLVGETPWPWDGQGVTVIPFG